MGESDHVPDGSVLPILAERGMASWYLLVRRAFIFFEGTRFFRSLSLGGYFGGWLAASGALLAATTEMLCASVAVNELDLKFAFRADTRLLLRYGWRLRPLGLFVGLAHGCLFWPFVLTLSALATVIDPSLLMALTAFRMQLVSPSRWLHPLVIPVVNPNVRR